MHSLGYSTGMEDFGLCIIPLCQITAYFLLPSKKVCQAKHMVWKLYLNKAVRKKEGRKEGKGKGARKGGREQGEE